MFRVALSSSLINLSNTESAFNKSKWRKFLEKSVSHVLISSSVKKWWTKTTLVNSLRKIQEIQTNFRWCWNHLNKNSPKNASVLKRVKPISSLGSTKNMNPSPITLMIFWKIIINHNIVEKKIRKFTFVTAKIFNSAFHWKGCALLSLIEVFFPYFRWKEKVNRTQCLLSHRLFWWFLFFCSYLA